MSLERESCQMNRARKKHRVWLSAATEIMPAHVAARRKMTSSALSTAASRSKIPASRPSRAQAARCGHVCSLPQPRVLAAMAPCFLRVRNKSERETSELLRRAAGQGRRGRRWQGSEFQGAAGLRAWGRVRRRRRPAGARRRVPRWGVGRNDERGRQRDDYITPVARHALRHYNARHPVLTAEFDAVRSLMQSTVHFRGELWYHINFWARSRKSNKIKRFFAEVHYKRHASSSVCSNTPCPVPQAEVHDRPSASSSVCSDQTISVPEAQVHHRPPASSSVCSYPPVKVPEVGVHEHDRSPASSSRGLVSQIPIVEVCTIIEEPLGRYRRSCAFCPGNRNILHPAGDRKFVCGNDKDRMVQQFHFSLTKRGRGLPCPPTTVIKRK